MSETLSFFTRFFIFQQLLRAHYLAAQANFPLPDKRFEPALHAVCGNAPVFLGRAEQYYQKLASGVARKYVLPAQRLFKYAFKLLHGLVKLTGSRIRAAVGGGQRAQQQAERRVGNAAESGDEAVHIQKARKRDAVGAVQIRFSQPASDGADIVGLSPRLLFRAAEAPQPGFCIDSGQVLDSFTKNFGSG